MKPASAPTTVPKAKRVRFWMKLLAWIIAVPLLLAIAFVILVMVDEARWSSHLKPAPPVADTVATYDATTGALLNASFLHGLTFPSGLAVAGNTLYVVQARGNPASPKRFDLGTVGTYDAGTGAPINTSLIDHGLINPQEVMLSGEILFVHNFGISKVAAYHAQTGALLNEAVIDNSFPAKGREGANMNLAGMTCSGGKLYVAQARRGVVRAYYPNAGAEIDHLEVCTGAVLDYDTATGAVTNKSLVGQLDCPGSLACSAGILYVMNNAKGTVGKFDAATGAAINDSLVRGLPHSAILAVAGESLYVMDNEHGTVGKYDARTGAAINTTLIKEVINPRGMAVFGNILYLIMHASGGQVRHR